ncbi:YkvI family membrane protein [Paludifilum halophilum]|uniref:Transporter n=1 Tax=Paludifilum halophilum TaxID=1642702 RepID=A0A235B6S4_9BACL|nr:hypothetical protein [Paludifilum halophilum]OYD07931.1 hypothetical protein CHM34_07350 [Paludifilum halophilum]
MRFHLWHSVKISMTVVGTTIGAGFASGREIWEFFGSYGEGSSTGVLLSMGLFFAATVIILRISWEKKTTHYSELLAHVIGTKLAKGFDGVVLLFLLTSTLVMVAGSGATFQEWNSSFLTGVWVMVGAVMVIVCFDLKGLMSMNAAIIPIMTAVLVLVCLHFLNSGSPSGLWTGSETEVLPVWPSAITYAAFNMISLLAVLSTMGQQIRHVGEIWVAGGISTLCLGLIAYLYNYSLMRVESLISQYEIPLFALVRDYSPVWVITISLILWLAIYTTAVSNIHGLIFRVSGYVSLPRWAVGGAVLLLLVPLSRLGFVNLITFLYPLYGVINLFLLTMLLLYPFSREKE